MEEVLRYEILSDHVSHQKLANILKGIQGAEYSAHRATSSKMYESIVTEEDISDAIAHDLLTVWLPLSEKEVFEQKLQKLIRLHSISVYKSTTQKLL